MSTFYNNSLSIYHKIQRKLHLTKFTTFLLVLLIISSASTVTRSKKKLQVALENRTIPSYQENPHAQHGWSSGEIAAGQQLKISIVVNDSSGLLITQFSQNYTKIVYFNGTIAKEFTITVTSQLDGAINIIFLSQNAIKFSLYITRQGISTLDLIQEILLLLLNVISYAVINLQRKSISTQHDAVTLKKGSMTSWWTRFVQTLQMENAAISPMLLIVVFFLADKSFNYNVNYFFIPRQLYRRTNFPIFFLFTSNFLNFIVLPLIGVFIIEFPKLIQIDKIKQEKSLPISDGTRYLSKILLNHFYITPILVFYYFKLSRYYIVNDIYTWITPTDFLIEGLFGILLTTIVYLAFYQIAFIFIKPKLQLLALILTLTAIIFFTDLNFFAHISMSTTYYSYLDSHLDNFISVTFIRLMGCILGLIVIFPIERKIWPYHHLN